MSPEKKEVVDRKNDLLRGLILAKLKTIQKEEFEPKSIDKLSLVFRVFLLRHLNLNYEFTSEELVNELGKAKISTKLKDRIISLLDLLTEIEYEDKQTSIQEFKLLLREAENIVNLATGEVEKKEKTEKKEEAKAKKGLLFNFLHKIGLVKAEEEKKAVKKKKLEKEKEKLELEALKKQREKERIKKQHLLEKEKIRELGQIRKEEKQKEKGILGKKRLKKRKEKLAKKQQEGIKKLQISESRWRLRKEPGMHELLKQVKEWKSEGYDTTLLEAELKGEIKVTGKLGSDASRLSNKAQEWKSNGYDVSQLEKEVRELKKKK